MPRGKPNDGIAVYLGAFSHPSVAGRRCAVRTCREPARCFVVAFCLGAQSFALCIEHAREAQAALRRPGRLQITRRLTSRVASQNYVHDWRGRVHGG